jgi:Ca-activated chloride channel family protein
MRVSDVKPTRMVAAQEAAKRVPARCCRATSDVALVTFAGNAQVVQRADERSRCAGRRHRRDHRCNTAPRSATQIVLSVAECFPDDGIDLSEITFGPGQPRSRKPGIKEKPPPKELSR